MSIALQSLIRTRHNIDLSEVPALDDARISAQSQGTEWRGLHIEVGGNADFNVDDVVYDGHLVGFNPTEHTYRFRLRHEGDWYAAHLPPGGFFVLPEGRPVSARREWPWNWGIAIVDSVHLDETVGARCALPTSCGFTNPLLRQLFLALTERLDVAGPTTGGLTATLVHAFMLALSEIGRTHPPEGSASGLSDVQGQVVRSWTEQRLHTRFTVEEMASEVGMSCAHFARQFRQAYGETPWSYVVRRRLERAARLLAEGVPVAVVACECGFSDQAHLSRRFKQHYGYSPAAYLRQTI